MPASQKYAMRIALVPSNAVEAVTFMDLKAVTEEIKRGQESGDYAVFDCIDVADTRIKVLVRAADIQLVIHNEFKRPDNPNAMPPRLVQ